jgi:hypothetical protein
LGTVFLAQFHETSKAKARKTSETREKERWERNGASRKKVTKGKQKGKAGEGESTKGWKQLAKGPCD